MVKRKTDNLPDITKRILNIIDDKFKGNVRRFSLAMGLDNSSKINRLFKKDTRSGEYPTPSTDIIILVSNTFDVSTDYLLKGSSFEESHTNNIEINANKIQGDKNIISNDSDINIEGKEEYMEIIKAQNDQIAQLLKIIKVNG